MYECIDKTNKQNNDFMLSLTTWTKMVVVAALVWRLNQTYEK